MVEGCVFCGLEEREPNRVFYSDELTLCAVDKYPVTKGHSLVIPKRHVESLAELNDEELLALMKTVVKVERALLEMRLGTGVDLRQHHRPFLPESELKVNHVHIHLLPRSEGDHIYQKALRHENALRDLSGDEGKAEAMAKAIGNAIKQLPTK